METRTNSKNRDKIRGNLKLNIAIFDISIF